MQLMFLWGNLLILSQLDSSIDIVLSMLIGLLCVSVYSEIYESICVVDRQIEAIHKDHSQIVDEIKEIVDLCDKYSRNILVKNKEMICLAELLPKLEENGEWAAD